MKDMKSLLCLLLAALMVTTLSIVALADVETIGKDTERSERFGAKVDYSQFDATFGALDGVGETEYGTPPVDVSPLPEPTEANPISTDKPAETEQPEIITGEQASAMLRQGRPLDAVKIIRALVGLSA